MIHTPTLGAGCIKS